MNSILTLYEREKFVCRYQLCDITELYREASRAGSAQIKCNKISTKHESAFLFKKSGFWLGAVLVDLMKIIEEGEWQVA